MIYHVWWLDLGDENLHKHNALDMRYILEIRVPLHGMDIGEVEQQKQIPGRCDPLNYAGIGILAMNRGGERVNPPCKLVFIN